jgi:hypothetical protein
MMNLKPQAFMPAIALSHVGKRVDSDTRVWGLYAALGLMALATAFVAGMWCQQQNLWPKSLLIKAELIIAGKDLTPQSVYQSKYAVWKDQPVTQPVVMLGDSLTEFGDWAEILDFDAVANRGVAKDTTEGLLRRIDVSSGHDGIVFLMIGTNDIAQQMKTSAIAGRYRKIVAALNDRGNRVYAESVLFSQDNVAFNRRVVELNAAIAQLCAEARNCTYIDVNKAVAPDGSIPAERTFDGVHVNMAGYRAWGKAIRPYMPVK